jgi:NhaP-type Na+/H+ or K+/H+ antiporter
VTTVALFLLLVFLYSLVSRRMERTILTAPALFTAAGMLYCWVSAVRLEGESTGDLLLKLAEFGLVLLLFTDASKTDLQELKSIRSLPIRLLSAGMLLTLLLGLLAAKLVFPQMTLWEAGILAAILAPTDAGLGQVIVNSPKVPRRIREALNVEAGLNDGLSVPFLLFFIALAAEAGHRGEGLLWGFVLEQLGLGTLIGLVIGYGGGWLLGLARRRQWATGAMGQLGLVALPLLCALASEHFRASMFIAAFVAGLAVQVRFKEAGRESIEFTEGWGQLANLLVFFLFGIIAAQALPKMSLAPVCYAVLSLTVVRMLPVALALIGTGLRMPTVLFMGWFGPRGLASIVLGLVFLEHEGHLPGETSITLAVVATVLLSIFAHGCSALGGINLHARLVGMEEEGRDPR